MTDKDMYIFGEVQYIKGRLDELHKALKNITNMQRQRLIDQRIEKYMKKLKDTSELAYYLYNVELASRMQSKEKSKNQMKELLTMIARESENTEINEKINEQILKYDA
jgi:translation elongation factor EF-1beta